MSDIVFCGFGSLGKKCIESLMLNNHVIKFILTHKDLSEDGVDTFAKSKGLLFFYNDLRRDASLKGTVDITGDDWLISINYRYILEECFFSLFEFAINIHGGLLPQYRGRTPHVWAIINGEKYAGITCHLIDAGVDTGAIVKQKRVKIEAFDTGFSLLQKYLNLYPDLLLESLQLLASGYKPLLQNNTEASFFGKRDPTMGYIDFTNDSSNIINFVRAQAAPYPGAYCFLTTGKKLIIDKVAVVAGNFSEILMNGVPTFIDGVYYVRCRDAILEVLECRKESK